MTTLDDIIDQSFQEEQNRLNGRKVKTSESSNVEKLFSNAQIIRTDCNICYENSTECIQCYQCDFKYCQECLTKIISEFNKCSACQANFKENYNKLNDKNKKKPTANIATKNTATKNTATKNTTTANTAPANSNISSLCGNEDLLSDYEIEQLALLIQMEHFNLESKTKLKLNNANNIQNNPNTEKKYSEYSDYSNNNANNNAYNAYNANNNYASKYLDYNFDDAIEPCQFQTVKQNSRYNFRVHNNNDNNELIYISNDYNLLPIILNYKLLDKCFQRTIFISLVELIDKPSQFAELWQTIASMIHNFTYNYKYLVDKNNKNNISNINKNQEFLYQKQDLINIINQLVS
jgi:hypothetical protein